MDIPLLEKLLFSLLLPELDSLLLATPPHLLAVEGGVLVAGPVLVGAGHL